MALYISFQGMTMTLWLKCWDADTEEVSSLSGLASLSLTHHVLPFSIFPHTHWFSHQIKQDSLKPWFCVKWARANALFKLLLYACRTLYLTYIALKIYNEHLLCTRLFSQYWRGKQDTFSNRISILVPFALFTTASCWNANLWLPTLIPKCQWVLFVLHHRNPFKKKKLF